MERFKKITGETDGAEKKALVVGSKTFESLPKTVLERSMVIVLSRTLTTPDSQNYFVEDDPNKALKLAERLAPNADEVIIGGGAQIYKLFLGLGVVNRIYITFIQYTFIEKVNDVRFPLAINEIKNNWKTVAEKRFPKDENNKWDLIFTTFERK